MMMWRKMTASSLFSGKVSWQDERDISIKHYVAEAKKSSGAGQGMKLTQQEK